MEAIEQQRRRTVVSLLALTAATAMACAAPGAPRTDAGVARDLAVYRAHTISNVRYALHFRIPAEEDRAVSGTARIALHLGDASKALVVDFGGADSDLAVELDGRSVAFERVHDHLVIPPAALTRGSHEIAIRFVASNQSLNRNSDFLYTLFVPARAHLAFPCFDQPDIKGRVTLSLDIPASWTAVANGARTADTVVGDTARLTFAETKPLSTYLVAFAAGKFQVDSAVRDGRLMHMYYRETDTAKVARNRDAIFDLHARALAWLEEYTGIPYPFGKFDFVLVPSFQYGGMEHAGAIYYNASGLMLDESATQSQLLGRASVIAHETSHMWFGDLVTMRWFNDVWMKEVFANFMAAKIVNPAFPEIDHTLRFLTAHYPSAYDVDRSDGANPIQQPLENLDDAGTLYGNIIYDKAPVVMQHLETLLGPDPFRDGLREYLRGHAYGNASWNDLIDVLDRRTSENLKRWSHAWVEEPGRPRIAVEVARDAQGAIGRLRLTQSDPAGRGRLWPQRLGVTLVYRDSVHVIPVNMDGASVTVAAAAGLPSPEAILPNGLGSAYGDFALDSASLGWVAHRLPELPTGLLRGVAWITLWDAVLDGSLRPERFLDLALRALPRETVELDAQLALGYATDVFWHYLTPAERDRVAPALEATLVGALRDASAGTLKTAYFRTYRSVAVTDSGVARLERIWEKRDSVPGVPLSENDYITLAEELAVRAVPGWRRILAEERDRIKDPDRRARFVFVEPALSADTLVRDSLFASLADAANRRHEPWVLEALHYLHHPLRAERAERYIRPSLDLLQEIQRTNDIFFPKRWLDATLGGHGSPSAAAIVREFLREHADYPAPLRAKILQAADPLFRRARIVGERGR